MIACDNCDFWFHFSCVGLDQGYANQIDKFYCKECIELTNLRTSWLQESCHVARTDKVKFYYPVEKILRNMIVRGKRFFLIDISDRTWEPEENLDGAINILQRYLESMGLGYSRVVGLMGSVIDDINAFNKSNWVTMVQVLTYIAAMMEEYLPERNIHFQEYENCFGETGIYFLRYVSHWYTIFWRADVEIAHIANGTDTFEKDQDTSVYIRNLLNVKCRSCTWLHNFGVKQCASAAILIGLEFVRDHFNRHFRRSL